MALRAEESLRLTSASELTEQKLLEVFKLYKRSTDVRISDLTTAQGLGLENVQFNSTLTKLKCKIHHEGTAEEVAMIVKTPQIGQMHRMLGKFAKPMLREVTWYKRLIPSMIADSTDPDERQFLSEIIPKVYFAYAQLPISDPWCQKNCCCLCYFPTMKRDNGLLIMEDLTTRANVRMPYKTHQHGVATVRVYLKTIAKFHGMAWRWLKRQETGELKDRHDFTKEEMEELDKGFFFPKFFFEKFILPDMIKQTRLLLTNRGRNPEFIAKVCRHMKRNTFKLFKEKVHPSRPSKFDTICHGDYWMTNTMCRFGDDGVPEQVFFIDFQQYGVSHPVFDLMHYLFSATSHTLRKNHLRELLCEYFDEFYSYLRPYTKATFEEFYADFEARWGYGYMVGYFMPVLSLYPEPWPENPSMREFVRYGERKCERIGSNDETHPAILDIQQRLLGLIEEADLRKLFD